MLKIILIKYKNFFLAILLKSNESDTLKLLLILLLLLICSLLIKLFLKEELLFTLL